MSVTDSQVPSAAADEPIRPYGDESLMTIEGVFEHTRAACRTADGTRLTCDPNPGSPAEISIDRIELAVDEMGIRVSNVEILP